MRKSILFAATAMLAAPAAAADIQIQVQGPVVEMTVNEVVQSPPDTATVNAGVTVRAPTAVEAMRQNAEAMNRVIARLRSLGIERKDIQTSSINLNAQYQYTNEGTPPRFLGYDAGNQVTVTLRKLDRTGAVLDALVAAGANNINGPSFSLEADAPAKSAARKAAFARAEAQAREYARLAGFQNLRLLEVSESFTGRGPIPFARDAIQVTASAAENTSVEPGQVGTGVTVTMKYEMTR